MVVSSYAYFFLDFLGYPLNEHFILGTFMQIGYPKCQQTVSQGTIILLNQAHANSSSYIMANNFQTFIAFLISSYIAPKNKKWPYAKVSLQRKDLLKVVLQ